MREAEAVVRAEEAALVPAKAKEGMEAEGTAAAAAATETARMMVDSEEGGWVVASTVGVETVLAVMMAVVWMDVADLAAAILVMAVARVAAMWAAVARVAKVAAAMEAMRVVDVAVWAAEAAGAAVRAVVVMVGGAMGAVVMGRCLRRHRTCSRGRPGPGRAICMHGMPTLVDRAR